MTEIIKETLSTGDEINLEIDRDTFNQIVIQPEDMAKLVKEAKLIEEEKKKKKGNEYKDIGEIYVIQGHIAEKITEFILRYDLKNSNITVENDTWKEEIFDLKIFYKTKLINRIEVKGKLLNWKIDYEDVKRNKVSEQEVSLSFGKPSKMRAFNQLYNSDTDYVSSAYMSNTLFSENLASSISIPKTNKKEDLNFKENNTTKSFYYILPEKDRYAELLDKIKLEIRKIDKENFQ